VAVPEAYVVILAGGSGTRLWPLSRSHHPKQLLAFAGDRSLLQATFDRVRLLVPPERVVVMTEQSHADGIREQLPELPPENVVVEPARRGTAGSLGLAAATIAQRSPNAVMASVHSDAHIQDGDEFRKTLAAAFAAADETRRLVLMGIVPTSPSTQFGYIEGAEVLGEIDGYPLQRVARFVEKPNLERARQFVSSGRYFWNPGVFVWRVDVILGEFARLQPRIHELVTSIAKSEADDPNGGTLGEVYPTVPVETIDVGIMEKSDLVAVIPARYGWSDIGSWSEIFDVLPRDADGNATQGTHLTLGSRDTLVISTSRPVATIGLSDIVVIETPDVVLVCPREKAQDVKLLVESLALDPARKDLL
jgi:mannose-1-phosphate guanylyltransferase